MASGPVWGQPTWQPRRKHRPAPGVAWTQLLVETSQPGAPAFYHPSVTEAIQEALELQCVASGTLIKDDGKKRTYYMDAGRLIGASEGHETTLVYAEHAVSGAVHGRPILASQLFKKGVQAMRGVKP